MYRIVITKGGKGAWLGHGCALLLHGNIGLGCVAMVMHVSTDFGGRECSVSSQ